MKNDQNLSGETETIQEEDLAEPGRYRVLLHNDDFTTQEFVVAILRLIFHMSIEDATAIMLLVHRTGIGQCGIYTQEIAESKVHLVRHQARMAGYPLRCTMEKV